MSSLKRLSVLPARHDWTEPVQFIRCSGLRLTVLQAKRAASSLDVSMKREVKSTESIGIVELDEVVEGGNVVETNVLELWATVVTAEESEVK